MLVTVLILLFLLTLSQSYLVPDEFGRIRNLSEELVLPNDTVVILRETICLKFFRVVFSLSYIPCDEGRGHYTFPGNCPPIPPLSQH